MVSLTTGLEVTKATVEAVLGVVMVPTTRLIEPLAVLNKMVPVQPTVRCLPQTTSRSVLVEPKVLTPLLLQLRVTLLLPKHIAGHNRYAKWAVSRPNVTVCWDNVALSPVVTLVTG